MDKGTWQTKVHGVANSQTQLSTRPPKVMNKFLFTE